MISAAERGDVARHLQARDLNYAEVCLTNVFAERARRVLTHGTAAGVEVEVECPPKMEHCPGSGGTGRRAERAIPSTAAVVVIVVGAGERRHQHLSPTPKTAGASSARPWRLSQCCRAAAPPVRGGRPLLATGSRQAADRPGAHPSASEEAASTRCASPSRAARPRIESPATRPRGRTVGRCAREQRHEGEGVDQAEPAESRAAASAWRRRPAATARWNARAASRPRHEHMFAGLCDGGAATPRVVADAALRDCGNSRAWARRSRRRWRLRSLGRPGAGSRLGAMRRLACVEQGRPATPRAATARARARAREAAVVAPLVAGRRDVPAHRVVAVRRVSPEPRRPSGHRLDARRAQDVRPGGKAVDGGEEAEEVDGRRDPAAAPSPPPRGRSRRTAQGTVPPPGNTDGAVSWS